MVVLYEVFYSIDNALDDFSKNPYDKNKQAQWEKGRDMPDKKKQSIPAWIMNLIMPIVLMVFAGVLTFNSTTTSTSAKSLENAEKIADLKTQLEKDNLTLRTEFVDKITLVERRYDERFATVDRRIEPLEQSRLEMTEMLAEMRSDLKYIRDSIELKKSKRSSNEN